MSNPTVAQFLSGTAYCVRSTFRPAFMAQRLLLARSSPAAQKQR